MRLSVLLLCLAAELAACVVLTSYHDYRSPLSIDLLPITTDLLLTGERVINLAAKSEELIVDLSRDAILEERAPRIVVLLPHHSENDEGSFGLKYYRDIYLLADLLAQIGEGKEPIFLAVSELTKDEALIVAQKRPQGHVWGIAPDRLIFGDVHRHLCFCYYGGNGRNVSTTYTERKPEPSALVFPQVMSIPNVGRSFVRLPQLLARLPATATRHANQLNVSADGRTYAFNDVSDLQGLVQQWVVQRAYRLHLTMIDSFPASTEVEVTRLFSNGAAKYATEQWKSFYRDILDQIARHLQQLTDRLQTATGLLRLCSNTTKNGTLEDAQLLPHTKLKIVCQQHSHAERKRTVKTLRKQLFSVQPGEHGDASLAYVGFERFDSNSSSGHGCFELGPTAWHLAATAAASSQNLTSASNWTTGIEAQSPGPSDGEED